MKKSILLWRSLSLAITYPLSFPALFTYFLTRDSRALDVLYSIRSLTHGILCGNGMRMAKYKGNWIVFPSREDPNFEDVFLRDVYYPFEPKSGDVVFDVGAHMGFFAVKIARQVSKVVAFEPDPYNYLFLRQNIQRNQLLNVLAFNCALGEEDGFLFIERNYGHGRTSVTQTNTGRRVTVRSLDSVINELKLCPTVVKIDTEGYECNILRGAQSTLIRSKPRLLLASYHYSGEAQELVKFLTDRAYRCYAYDVPLTLQKLRETYVYAEPSKGRFQST